MVNQFDPVVAQQTHKIADEAIGHKTSREGYVNLVQRSDVLQNAIKTMAGAVRQEVRPRLLELVREACESMGIVVLSESQRIDNVPPGARWTHASQIEDLADSMLDRVPMDPSSPAVEEFDTGAYQSEFRDDEKDQL